VFLIGLGLIKKVIIADFLARHVVDPTFAVPEAFGAPDMWLAIYCYAAQIYCDFSGYTDIAIGLALLMGYVFPRNFHSPYRASSFRDFWRRWHMTLSRYLRDFLYIPLGGNRGGKWGTARNLMLTMLLGGLWHGAAWGFVLWGGLHGLYLGAERILRGRFKPLPTWLGWLVVLNLVVLAWIPFRAPDLGLASTFFGRLFHPGALTLLSPGVVVALLLVFGLQLIPERPVEVARGWFENLSPAALGLGLAVCVAVVGATVPGQAVPPFIYFQF
jgi:alginate O-acetyltransferase complex protein AlgI